MATNGHEGLRNLCQDPRHQRSEPSSLLHHSQAELSHAPDPGCPVFSVPCPSLEETLQFLLETDYNHPGHKLYLPPPLSTPKLSATIPLTHTTSVVGYISNKHPDCYVWQSGFFEAGSHVVLGTTYRKAKMEWEIII